MNTLTIILTLVTTITTAIVIWGIAYIRRKNKHYHKTQVVVVQPKFSSYRSMSIYHNKSETISGMLNGRSGGAAVVAFEEYTSEVHVCAK